MKNKVHWIIVFLLCAVTAIAQSPPLGAGFHNPPNEAKARTWWHWMNGNVSRSGITADLEAMKEVGIQEAQLFNVKLSLPEGPVKYLSPEWLDLFQHAAREAKRLGLELAFHNSAGWSSSGGPWITPEHAMQTVVYSEVTLNEGDLFDGFLPQPESKLDYYRDIAVFAFPKPESDIRIDNLDYKNLSDRIRNHLTPDTKSIPQQAIVKETEIINLTSMVSADGHLKWEALDGDWIILRIGHTPTGKKNHPAVPGGHGLECDKMSKKAVDAYWQGGITPIIKKLGDLIGTVVNNCIIDSYEVGATNWTSGFENEFLRLRGYSLINYLPTMAGYYVNSGEQTERFLWDFRRTIGDLMAENYYSHFRELCHKEGMKFSVEPYWGPFDNMQVGATGDIVMCEFWSGGYPFFDSPKFVSSIAHLNGSSIVGAEAFTGIGGWDEHPATLKSIGDRAWAQGINRFIFHTYVHQPWDVAPGLALSYHGTDFNRLNTWWKQGKAFMDYVGRSQFLLQQGRNVADVLVFTGESSPNTAFLMPEIKALGYDYDLIGYNKIKELTVKDGQICTPVGGRYQVLVLPEIEWMRPETLLKLEELAVGGATIIGQKPIKSPSLKGYPESDKVLKDRANKLWGSGLIKDLSIINLLNNGLMIPDFRVQQGGGEDISFIHRKTKDSDIYFVANAQKVSRELNVQLRVGNKIPEFWNPETGEIKKPAIWKDNGDGTTSIPIHLEAEGSVFLVFRIKSRKTEHIQEATSELSQPKSEPLSNLKIIQAEYGTFLQEGLVDVTDRVVQAVKNGKLNINANRHFCDCDPAMGYKKEFRLEFQIGDSIKRIDVMEREDINIDAEGKGQLKILKAVFGKFKPETKGVPKYYRTYDITNKLKSLVSSGTLNITVDETLIDGRQTEGSQPALRVTYSTDSEEHTVIIPKGKKLNLCKDLPKPDLIIDEGKMKWISPYPGKLTYKLSSGTIETEEIKRVPNPIELNGEWKLKFPLKNEESKEVVLNDLTSWSLSSSESIKYFSGTASYRNQFQVSEELLQKDFAYELDLGSVRVIAEVILNGKFVGTLWKAPFRINIDDYILEGDNQIEIRITNLWPNRLIGDEALPLDFEREKESIKQWPQWLTYPTDRSSGRITFASHKHWDKDSPLQTSGLLGPVKIYISKVMAIK
ncbi:MAG: hypothetical protein HKN68_00805 [Saprospiraceae bacterium]|nr:hypothetical protein [Saprospiraceae bacterium]